MANVFTSLAGDIYRAADMVGRELVGIIPSCTINSGSERVALNDTVRSFFTRVPTVGSLTPSMTIPEGTDQTVDNKTLTIDQTAGVFIPYTGEDVKHLNNGSGFETVQGDQIAQAMRVIVNQIESFIWTLTYKASSRAFGTLGTTPFASNFNEVAEVRQILVDNGCPMDGQVTLCLSSTAGTKLRNLAQLQKANEAGGTQLLRQGTLLDLQNLMLKESAAITQVTKGTGASYVTSGSTAVGVTDIALVTGTGTVLAGDIVTFAADATNKYVVNTGVAAPGTISLGAPGARVVIGTANALTVGNSYTPNVAFHKAAVEVAMRPMADPPGGDAAFDTMIVQDPWSGLVFELKAYKGFKKMMILVSCVYGGKAWKSQHIATLAG